MSNFETSANYYPGDDEIPSNRLLWRVSPLLKEWCYFTNRHLCFFGSSSKNYTAEEHKEIRLLQVPSVVPQTGSCSGEHLDNLPDKTWWKEIRWWTNNPDRRVVSTMSATTFRSCLVIHHMTQLVYGLLCRCPIQRHISKCAAQISAVKPLMLWGLGSQRMASLILNAHGKRSLDWCANWVPRWGWMWHGPGIHLSPCFPSQMSKSWKAPMRSCHPNHPRLSTTKTSPINCCPA